MSANKEINPFYLLSEWEVAPLIEIWKNHANVKSHSISFLKLDLMFNNRVTPSTAQKQLETDKENAAKEGRNKTIYAVTAPTNNTESYHVHKDGFMTAVEGRNPQIRSYFDGSQMSSYGHSIMISINHDTQRVVVKDPKGNDLNDDTKRLLLDVYPDYAITIDRRCQQFDNNNCYSHTLHNMLAMAGFVDANDKLDINDWNKEIRDYPLDLSNVI